MSGVTPHMPVGKRSRRYLSAVQSMVSKAICLDTFLSLFLETGEVFRYSVPTYLCSVICDTCPLAQASKKDQGMSSCLVGGPTLMAQCRWLNIGGSLSVVQC
jgi:hypothetical protein